MTSDAKERKLQRAMRRRWARFVQRWLHDEAFLAPRTRRFQFPSSVLVIMITWTAVVLGISLWVIRFDLTDTSGLWVAIVLMAFLGILPFWACVERVLYLRRVLRWPQARARIVRYWIKRYSSDDVEQVVYHPVFSFQTAEGKEVVAISRSAPSGRWPRGTEVLVHYDPRNPVHAEVPSLLRRGQLVIMIVAPLAVAFAVGLICFFLSHR